MLHALRRALLLTLAILLLFASSAAAACAWVLWAKMTPQDWEVSNTYPTEAACKDTILVWMAQVDPNDRLGPATLALTIDGKRHLAMYLCTPDTIDPRAPKGGGR